jgi:TonB-linked SusC/RagA family outer membrane protein
MLMRKLLWLVMGFLLLSGQLLAQDRTITGKVTDENGTPIPNASVTVKGTTTGTTSKPDGTYSLTVSNSAKVLVFSSIGSASIEVTIGSKTTIDATLNTSSTELQEVIVQVPYGTVKKTAFTGSEVTVTNQTLQKQQVTSVTRALDGLVPGIIATNGGGAPGTNASIMIRGVGSYGSSSAPLYVVNGIPFDGSIAALSVDEIESVSVLKDATASALYGSRAANGVIMITTKQGKKGKAAISVTARQGYMSRGIPEYDRIGAQDYYETMWEAIRNTNVYASGATFAAAGTTASNTLITANTLVYNAYNVPNNQVVDPTTGKLNSNAKLLWNDSWEEALYRNASRQNVTVTISGANDKTSHLLSAGYLNEEGILKFSGYKRYNMRLDLRTAATTWLNAGLNLDGAFARQDNVLTGGTTTSNPFYYTRQMGPIYPVWQRDANGNIVQDPIKGGNMLDWGTNAQMGARPYAPNSNLLGSLDLDDRYNKIFQANANSFAEILFLKDFSFKTTVGVNIWNNNGTTYQNSQFGDAQNVAGRSTKSNTRQVSLTVNEVLTWNKRFGDHSFRVLAGHENYRFQTQFVSATKTTFPFPGATDLDNAATIEGASSNEDHLRIESYFGGINYDFKQKYLVSASYRRDGTSRFAKDQRWGNFYSAGIGWRISQEEFMQTVGWINELKLKASYGEMGNQAISSYYAYQNLYNLGWNNANRPGAVVGAPPTPELLWEGNKTFNVGFDFSFFSNRLQGTVEYFNRISDNLIFEVPLPTSTGNLSKLQNIGELKNAGFELQLGYNAVRTKSFDWRIDLNLTHFRNKLTKMPPTRPEIIDGSAKLMVGKSLYDFWLREYAGVDASTGDAIYYKDVLDAAGKPTGKRSVTNVINDATFYYHGSALPDISGGITNSLRYKNFDLSFLVTFAYGGKFYDGNYQALMHRGSYGTAWHSDIMTRWRKPGDVTNVPRVQNAIAGQDGNSTRYLFDGSYLNIKNITLSYTLSKSVLNRLGGLSGIQIFGNVDNANLFSSHKGMDPQRAFSGTADWTYSVFRTVTFGFNVNL